MCQEQVVPEIEYKVKLALTINNQPSENYYSITIRVEGYATIEDKRLKHIEETTLYGISGENAEKITRKDVEDTINDFKRRIAEKIAEAYKVYSIVKRYSEENGYEFSMRVI